MSDQLPSRGDPRAGEPHADALRQEPIGELLKRLSDEITTLERMELDLAKAEMTRKGKEAGTGAGLLGGAGVVALLMLGSLTAFLIALLATVMSTWLAALIVTVLLGDRRRPRADRQEQVAGRRSPAPEQTIDTVKENVQRAKSQTRSGRT